MPRLLHYRQDWLDFKCNELPLSGILSTGSQCHLHAGLTRSATLNYPAPPRTLGEKLKNRCSVANRCTIKFTMQHHLLNRLNFVTNH
uniref:Uncharacterized protein n=1 Tax=Anguilla anguilla TaxID=7936 RepID=A0A0E9X805_ANGAN